MNAPRLTPLLHAQIVAAIRAGAYPHVAAMARGVSAAIFEDWIKRGEQPHRRGRYAHFAAEVREARAQARVKAECEVLRKSPLDWLVHGLGREAPGNAGWSVVVKPHEATEAAINALLDPRLLGLFHRLLDVLTPFPEARAAAAAQLVELDVPVKDAGMDHQQDKAR